MSAGMMRIGYGNKDVSVDRNRAFFIATEANADEGHFKC